MDFQNNLEEIDSLSYRELQKLCKENGIKGTNRKKEQLQHALLQLRSNSDEDLLFNEKVKKDFAGRKRAALSDISDVTANIPSPPCKKHIDSNITLGSSLFSEFECSLKAISSSTSTSTPARIDLCNTSNSTNKENELRKFSSKVFSEEEKYHQLVSKFEASAKAVFDRIEVQRSELDRHRCSGNNYLKVILEQELSNKENELSCKYNVEIEQLKKEKNFIENRYTQQKNDYKVNVKDLNENITHMDEEISQLKDGNKLLKDKFLELDNTNKRTIKELNDDKTILVNRLQAKDVGYNLLEEERNRLRLIVEELHEKIEVKDNELKTQVEMVQSLNVIPKHTTIEDMEDEFSCIICQELFINAITLPCGHSFCEQCLRTWFKTKKTCPVCRRNVKLKGIPSVTLDSAVERILDSMDEETKRKRMQLKRERNEQKRTEDVAPDHHGIRSMFHSVDGNNSQVVNTQTNAHRNVARRRSRSQSPARNLNQRANQILNQIRPMASGSSNSNASNSNANNSRNNNQNNPWNQWRNNNFSVMNSHGNNNQNRQFVRCFRCGSNGHVASQCSRR